MKFPIFHPGSTLIRKQNTTMSYHLVSTSHFMFLSIAQLLLVLQVCLGREGTIEESIRTKRVISYPKSGHSDFSKKIVETFHRVVKKILPKNDTDYTDSKASLNGRKRTNPKSFEYDVEDGVLSESGGYSVKVLDPSENSSNADESFYDGDVLIDRPIIRKSRVIKRSPPEEDSTTEKPNDSEDYARRVRNVWKRVEEIISEKKIRRSTLLNSLKRRYRKHRKRKSDDDDDDDDEDDETQIESGVESDRVKLLSLLPVLPVSNVIDDVDESDDVLQILFLCVFGAFSLLGMAILIMGIYSAALTHIRGGEMSPEPLLENFKWTCLRVLNMIPGFGSAVKRTSLHILSKISGYWSADSALLEGTNSKMEGSEGSPGTGGPKRNPEDVSFLLRTFVRALNKKPSRSLNQKYGSKTHLRAVRRIIRRKR